MARCWAYGTWIAPRWGVSTRKTAPAWKHCARCSWKAFADKLHVACKPKGLHELTDKLLHRVALVALHQAHDRSARLFHADSIRRRKHLHRDRHVSTDLLAQYAQRLAGLVA